ncbi:MAG: tRNA 2-thiouridine(34) synthase MnmA [Candidatus Omnitrophota bacterium]
MKKRARERARERAKKRVLVAMSGGVDSSMAAYLLKKEGYQVSGITMDFKGFRNLANSRKIAKNLGITQHIIDIQGELEKKVISDFCTEYLKGKTPNPCVRCNQYIKFGYLLREAKRLKMDFMATGHYARIVKRGNSLLLEKGKDPLKEQSYFLYRLSQYQLKNILFPLGAYTKQGIISLAKEIRLSCSDIPSSQEICFLKDKGYKQFIKKRISNKIKPGAIVDKEGRILGKHKGVAFYTVGQREGLGIAKGYPLYISRINFKNNQIIVGPREEALRKEFLVKQPNFIINPIKKKIALKVRIRYNHKEASAEVSLQNTKIKVKFKEPQFAITPGQSAVFYDRDSVIGGGIIDRVLD